MVRMEISIEDGEQTYEYIDVDDEQVEEDEDNEQVEEDTTTKKKLDCKKCKKQFPSIYQLKKHRKEFPKHSVGNFKSKIDCQFCGFEFKNIIERINHENLHLVGLNAIKCPLCNVKVSSCFLLKTHILKTHDIQQRNSICQICKVKSESNVFLVSHYLKTHINLEKAACHLCGEDFNRTAALFRHYTSHIGAKGHPSEIKAAAGFCEVCDKGFFKKSDLLQHSKIHGNKVREKHSNVVKVEEIQEQNLSILEEKPVIVRKRYEKNNDPFHNVEYDADGRWPCPLCNKKYGTRASLIDHKYKCGSQPVPCEVCGKVLKHKSNLSFHKRMYHPKDPSSYDKYWKFICHICEWKFCSKAKLTEHDKVHKNMRDYQCAICGNYFLAKHNCQNHIARIHSLAKQDAADYVIKLKESVVCDPVKKMNMRNTKKSLMKDEDIEFQKFEKGGEGKLIRL